MADQIKSMLNSSKLKLQGKNGNFWSSFRVITYGNNPRIEVETGNPEHRNAEKGWGKVRGPMSPVDFYAFLELIDKVISTEGECTYIMTLKDQPYVNGAKSKEVEPVFNLTVGRTGKGLIYVKAEDLSVKRLGTFLFPFGSCDRRFVRIGTSGTEEIAAPALTDLYARSWRNTWKDMVSGVLVKDYTPPQPPQGKGGYGGGQSQSQNRGGQSQSQTQYSTGDGDFDNDMPF